MAFAGAMAARLRQREIQGATPGDRRSCSTKGKLTLPGAEVWRFVGSQEQQVWLWLALDAETRLIVGVAIGPRHKATAEDLGYSLPPDYRQRAGCFTDFYQV
jgi:insertion element IS1 protein InsB